MFSKGRSSMNRDDLDIHMWKALARKEFHDRRGQKGYMYEFIHKWRKPAFLCSKSQQGSAVILYNFCEKRRLKPIQLQLAHVYIKSYGCFCKIVIVSMGEANSFQRRGNCARDFDYEAADLSYDAYLLLVIGKLSYSFYSRIYFKNYCAFTKITENN